MYYPDGNELSKAQSILSVGVPKAYREYASVIGKHDSDVALSSFVTFTRFGYIVDVDYAPYNHQIARSRLE
jgi:hypothetical protein